MKNLIKKKYKIFSDLKCEDELLFCLLSLYTKYFGLLVRQMSNLKTFL